MDTALTRTPAEPLHTLAGTSDTVPARWVWAAAAAGAAALHLTLPVADVAAAAAVAVVQVFAVLAAFVDQREGRIPNSHTRWMLITVLTVAVTLNLLLGTPGQVWSAVLAGAGTGLALTLLSLVSGGIGMGDVKFLAVAGFALWPVHPAAIAVLIAVSCVGVTAHAAIRRCGGAPVGPWIAVSLIPAVLIAGTIPI